LGLFGSFFSHEEKIISNFSSVVVVMSFQIVDWLTVVVVSMLTVVEAVATAMGLMIDTLVDWSI